MPRSLTRAELLSGGMRGGAAVLLAGSGLGAFAATADAMPPNYGGPLPAGDLAYVRLMLAWELLLIDFYSHALGAKHLDRAANDRFRLARANEQAHYTYLAGVETQAGGIPLTAADVDFSYPTGGFYTARSIEHLGAAIEGLALSSYLGAGGNVATPALMGGLTQIAANEAQHLSAIQVATGAAPFQDAFPATMTMEDSSNALDSYTS